MKMGPVCRKARRTKELGPEQVPILLPWPSASQHGEQFVMHPVKGPLAEVRWLPEWQDLELVGRVAPKMHLG